MTRTHWIIAALGALAVSQVGCTNVDCGDGTIDKNGACVPAQDSTNNASCGPGTVLKAGQCVPDHVTMCDPSTTITQTDSQGNVTCVGTGTQGCGAPIGCPAPAQGKVTICGQLLDLETSAPIADGNATGKACTATTSSGPCSMTIKAYDAIAFAGDPTGAAELTHDPIVIDDCGRYRVANIQPNGAAFIGIGLDDAMGAPDTHRLSGVAIPTVASKAAPGIPAYAMKTSTDTSWTSQAGLTGGSFADRGVYVGIFLHGTMPVSGVKVVRGGVTNPAQHFYFKDTDPSMRSMIDTAATATGVNGTAVTIGNGSLTTYTGSGSEPANCKWPSLMGDEIPMVAFIEPLVAVLASNPNMNCP
jgi:hypothetical protein